MKNKKSVVASIVLSGALVVVGTLYILLKHIQLTIN